MRKLLLLIILLVPAMFIVAVLWLFYTEAGLHFALRSASKLTSVYFRAGTATGRLADTFALRDIEVRLADVRLSVSALTFSWQPARLLTGDIAADYLSVKDVDIEDRQPESKDPVMIKWPRVRGPAAGTRAWVRDFRLERVSYRRSGGRSFTLNSLEAGIYWHHGIISITGLSARAPEGSVSGTIEAGFLEPALKADVEATIKGREAADAAKRVTIRADLTQGRTPEMLTGAVSAKVILAQDDVVDLKGQVGLLQNGVVLRNTNLTHSAVAGSATLAGNLLLGNGEPTGRFDITLNDIQSRKGGDGRIIVAGHVSVSGLTDDYKGRFRLENKGKGWQAATVHGDFEGNRESARATITGGEWLGGSLRGTLRTAWKEGIRLFATLSGRKFNPALLNPEWTGVINLNAKLDLTRTDAGVFQGAVKASFPKSALRGRALTGELDADFQGNRFHLARLDIHGKGFDIQAAGIIQERLRFEARVSDMAGLIPGVGGSVQTIGWVRWRNGKASGSIEGKGSKLMMGGATVQKVAFTSSLTELQEHMTVDVKGHGIGFENLRLDSASVTGAGRKEKHSLQLDLGKGKMEAHLLLEGGLQDRTWKGMIERLYGTDNVGPWKLESPAALEVSESSVQVGTLTLRSGGGETLTAGGEAGFNPLRGSFAAAWSRLHVSRLQPFLPRGKLNGSSTGRVSIQWPKGGSGQLRADATFDAQYKESQIVLDTIGKMTANWDEKGIKAGWELAFGDKGKFTGSLASTGPAPPFEFPGAAVLAAAWQGVDLTLLAPWLPSTLSVAGQASGKVEGQLLPGKVVNLKGSTEITRGSAVLRPGNGIITTAVEKGSINFSWSGNALQGDMALTLTNYGTAEGRFSLPLPARLPPAFVPEGPLSVSVQARVREQGLVTALLPGLVNETKGRLDVSMTGSGTWARPSLAGTIRLEDAGAYLPSAGIHIKNLRAEAKLEGDSIRVLRIRAESGTGWIEATGNVALRNWRPVQYRGELNGEGFEAINLPELRVSVNPAITFQGDSKLLSARGDITVPRMLIYGQREQEVIEPSADIRVIDAPKRKEKRLPVTLDVQIRVILKDNVTVEARGIDARLAGTLNVSVQDLDRITARGTIRVVKGGYRAYGIRLEITRGNITFYGPVDRPTLDILAVKQTGDVTAGVEVTGSARAPTVNLYSNPSMPDTDKLSYIVLGRPLGGADAGASSLFMNTAGSLQSGPTAGFTTEGRLRAGVAAGQDEAVRSMVSVGRYLSPELYVGLGHSLLTNENQVTLRYKLSKRWEVESRLGGESGMDLFYRIDFD